MKLASLIQPEVVLCSASASDYSDAKGQLLERLADVEDAPIDKLAQELEEREGLGTTVVAPGIAFPHARTELVNDFHICVGTFPQGFAVEGQEEPVKLVVLHLVPEGASNLYLRCVSSMARFLAAAGNLDKLLDAADSDTLIEMIERAGVLVKDVVTARDIMHEDPITCGIETTLREVADMMVKNNVSHVPVLDEQGTYLGMVTANRLLRVGIPDYIIEMDDISFLSDFEPFEQLLKGQQSLTVDSILTRDFPVFMDHTPMIVVANKLVREKLECAAVIDHANRHFIGMIAGIDFVHKVVRA